MSSGDSRPLTGVRIVAFEARRAVELGRMLERHGATVISAPAMREAPLPPSAATAELARALAAGEIATLVLLTGVGTKALAAQLPGGAAAVPALFARTTVVARGPKPLAALRELGAPEAIAVPSPNTWREVLTTLDGAFANAKTDWSKIVKLSLLLQRGANLDSAKRILAQKNRLSVPEIEFTFVDGFAGEKYLIEIEATTLSG